MYFPVPTRLASGLPVLSELRYDRRIRVQRKHHTAGTPLAAGLALGSANQRPLCPWHERMDKQPLTFHEAAHAVMIHHFGGTCERVVLESDREGKEWEGRATRKARTLTAERNANVAFAGPLAEAKFFACETLANDSSGLLAKALGNVCFDQDDQMESYLSTVLEQNEDCLDVTMSFRSLEKPSPFSVQVFVGIHLDDVSTARGAAICDLRLKNETVDEAKVMASLNLKMLETRKLLDKSPIWQRVTKLARRLQDIQEQTVLRIELSGEETTAIIDSAK